MSIFSQFGKLIRDLGRTYITDDIFITGGGRDTLIYHDKDHATEVFVELLFGKINRSFGRRSISRWLPPFEEEVIDEAKKDEIIRNIATYYQSKGITFQIID